VGSGSRVRRGFIEKPRNPTRSKLEKQFLDFCEQFGLPEPEVNVPFKGFEADALFRVEKLIVELDGWNTHSSRVAFERDRDRDATALEDGLATIRVTSDRMRLTGHKEAARLRLILAKRRA
jgi:hypothetical protein